MTDRELMQQALEYMESVGQMDMHPEEWAIAVALRERLTQPQRTHWEGCEEVHPECKKTLAQPEQEPVAWGYRDRHGNIIDVITPAEHTRAEGDYRVPLYTKEKNA